MCESCRAAAPTHWLRISKLTFAVCENCGNHLMQYLAAVPLFTSADLCLSPVTTTTAIRARWPFQRKCPQPVR